jgi:hypothetical protein
MRSGGGYVGSAEAKRATRRGYGCLGLDRIVGL